MQSQDIRLRLVIRRHGVPEIKLVWPCACSEDLTVARLLEQVNEVIPLESGEWGLEDYAVELADGKGGSFECLHFQQVGRIFKDEDQVLIRSLLTGDLKRRRLSGRHQVSEDGRHLVDGLAFGRPWLRTPRDRPQIELPPRKRARIVYNDDDEDDEDEEEREQLLLEAPNPPQEADRSLRLRARFEDEDEDSEEYREGDYNSEGSSSDTCGFCRDEDDLNEREVEQNGYEAEDDALHGYDEDLGEELHIPRRHPDVRIDNSNVRDEDGEERSENDGDDEDDELDDEDEDLAEELRLLRQDAAAEILKDNIEAEQVDEPEDDSEDSDSDSDLDRDLEDGENDDIEEDHEDLQEEVRLLAQENAALEEDPLAQSKINPLDATSLVGPNEEAGHIDFSSLDLLTALWSAFPAASIRAVELELIRAGKDLRQAYISLASVHDSVISFAEMMVRAITSLPSFSTQPALRSSEDTTFHGFDEPLRPLMEEIEGSRKTTRPLIEEVESIEEHATNDFDDSPSVMRKSNQSAIADDATDAEESDTSNRSSESEEDESSLEEDESSSDSDSEDDSSSGGEEESHAEEQTSVTRTLQVESEVSSSEMSSSDSDTSESDSGSDNGDNEACVDEPMDSSDDSSGDSSDSDSSDESDSDSESEIGETPSKPPVRSAVPPAAAAAQTSEKLPVVPGNGSSRTQKRNARRRRNKMLRQQQSESASENGTSTLSEEFLARQQALLASIVDDTANVTEDSQMQVDKNTAEDDEQMEHPSTIPEPVHGNLEVGEQQTDEPPSADAPQEESAKRRNRFDLGAGRRLLFGALGLKAPKSKADEEKIRQNLMKDVRPLNNPRVAQADTEPVDGDENNAAAADDDEDPDSWKDKIIFRAVECCYDNMVLSEPPFPFVQRWDPQQKYENMKKRKRASENFQAETSFAGDESYYYEDEVEVEQEVGRKKKKKKKKGKSAGHVDERMNGVDASIVLNYDDTPAKSSQFTDMDDLPSLPGDPSTLPTIEPGTTKPGMVITWKQLLMSKATKWQPELVSITGLVIPGGDDTTLHVILAKRDREQDDKVYDENTGQRVYDKFEAPDMDEASEEEDTGFRELQWGEMIEPRLLQHEPTTGMFDTPMKANDTTLENKKPSEDENAEAEVSDFQTLEECLAHQLSAEQVRAAVEEDVIQAGLQDTQENPEPVTIQSGQQMPRLDLSTSGDEVQVSTAASDSWDILRQKNSDLSKTLEAQSEKGSVGVASPGRPQSQDLSESIREEGETAADQEAEPGSRLADVADGDVSDSDNFASKPAHPSGDYGSIGSDMDVPFADDSSLFVPSSQISIRSGRQPQADDNMEDAPEDDTVIPETLPQLRETTPISNDMKHQGTPANSSSPFPSLEEIFTTAKQTQSPFKRRGVPASSARKPKATQDLDYEEAMRKLDEGHESEYSPITGQGPGALFPNATQPPASVKFDKKEPPSAESGFTKSTGKKSEKSPFVIPAGSQVILLSSSSPSSPAQEDADDGLMDTVDETVTGRRSTLPTGPGWVKKSQDDASRSRTKSMPAVTTGARRARRQGGSPSPAPLVSAVSKYKARRNVRQSSWRG